MKLRKNQPGFYRSRDSRGRITWRREAQPSSSGSLRQAQSPVDDIPSTQDHLFHAQEIVKHFQDHGFNAYRSSDLYIRLFHSYSLNKPEVGKITDVKELSFKSTKPRQALWLSAGDTDSEGVTTTAWNAYVDDLEGGLILPQNKESLVECILHDDAVIVELESNNDIGKLYDMGILEFKPQYAQGTTSEFIEYQDENGEWIEDWEDVEITREMIVQDTFRYCNIDYPALAQQGVDAIRVRGEEFFDDDQSYFQGWDWDIDSVAILHGDCIQRFDDVN